MPATGGLLGCASEYGVVVHWRGGRRQFIPTINGVQRVVWGRLLSDTADATVEISKTEAGEECCQRLGQVEPWIHELSLYRDGALVWQGPVVDPTETRSTVVLTARDVTGWLERRMQHNDHDFTNVDVTEVARRLVWDALASGSGVPDDGDPNVVPHLVTIPSGINVDYHEPGNKHMVLDQIRELIKLGMDYTTSGRAVLLIPEATKDDPPQARLDDSWLLGDVEVARSGLDTATRVVARGQGVSGAHGGVDPYWGLLETTMRVQTKQARDCERAARTFVGQSVPPPVVVRVPGQATLAPDAPVPIEQLVCGFRFDVALGESFCRRVVGPQRLAGVQVTWEAGATETVNVSLAPMGAAEDLPAAGGGVV